MRFVLGFLVGLGFVSSGIVISERFMKEKPIRIVGIERSDKLGFVKDQARVMPEDWRPGAI